MRDAIFPEKVPKIKDDEREKWLVGAEYCLQGPKCWATRMGPHRMLQRLAQIVSGQ